MTQPIVNVGSVAGDGTGDKGQVPFQKVNAGFAELYGTAFFVGTDSGVVNAPVVTLASLKPNPAAGYAATNGTIVRFTPAFANTGAVSFTFAGVAAAVVNSVGAALTGGEFQLNTPIILQFNGTAWQIIQFVFRQTAAEIAASRTPTNFSVQPQNPMPFRYGAVGNGTVGGPGNNGFITSIYNINYGTNDFNAVQSCALSNPGALIDGGGFTYFVAAGALPATQVPAGSQWQNVEFLSAYTVNTVDNWDNVAIGFGALLANTFIPEQFSSSYAPPQTNWAAGNHNVAIGGYSMNANTTGRRNTCVGSRTMVSSTSAYYNTFVGSHSGQVMTTGHENVGMGVQSLGSLTTGAGNTGIGTTALNGLISGANNVGVGNLALIAETAGSGNVGVGYRALYFQNGASDNVAVGRDCLLNSLTGVQNNAVGAQCMLNLTTGARNNAMGQNAMHSALTSVDCVAIGDTALNVGTANAQCVAVGTQAGNSVTSNDFTGVGYRAGLNVTGAQNTLVGSTIAPTLSTGDHNTGVGYGADFTAASTNSSSIGNSATCTGSNQVTLGNGSITTLRCQVTTITAISDVRDKKDIETIPSGLALINAVRPVKFTWAMRDGAKVDEVEAGFIAQELKTAAAMSNADWVGLVDETNPERLEASPGKLLPFLVRAVQELSAQNQALLQRIAVLEHGRSGH